MSLIYNMFGPHSRCNYLDENKRIIIGAYPRDEDIPIIIQSGVTVFINLTEQNDYKLDENIIRLHYPIKSGSVPSIKKMNEIYKISIDLLNQNHKIYIHCTGGHGRASVIASVLIGRLNDMDACEAIHYVESCRNEREDKSRNFIPVPETNKQVEFIGKMLGYEGKTLPDRSDTSWLKRVKKERIKTIVKI